MRCWPILLVAFLLPEPWGLRFAADPLTLACFLLSLALALCVTGAFQMIIYFSCFYTLSSDGIRSILMPVGEFLSGGLIPLPFMPDWLSVVIKYSPYGLYETAGTFNSSWGFKYYDQNWLTAQQIVQRRKKLNEMGINYLLNVGPDGLGRIPSFSQEALLQAAKEF
jgi:hypothetical protein